MAQKITRVKWVALLGLPVSGIEAVIYSHFESRDAFCSAVDQIIADLNQDNG